MENPESSNQHSLSLIPYEQDSRGVVLRHGSAVVYYDERSRSISLRNVNAAVDLYECPYCHRPFKDGHLEDSQEPVASTDRGVDASYVNPGYFRMLHYSREGSQASSRSLSPKRLDNHAAEPALSRLPQLQSSSESSQHSEPVRPSSSHRISETAFSQGYFKKFFVEERELGRGGKGVVLLVRHVLDDVDLGLYACKRVPVGDDNEWLKKVLVEVQLLENLSHQNIVSYRHVWLENTQITNFGPAVPCAFILQRYCNGGDLHHYIFASSATSITKEQMKERARRRSKGQSERPTPTFGPRRMPFDEIFSFFRDITSGLNYLHEHNYIHRDLKPSNCLLHNDEGRIRVLVSDFGEMQSAQTMRTSSGSTGTISFCAPEVLRPTGEAGALGNFSKKSDIFSLGMIVHLMCFGHLPYANSDAVAEENENLDLLREEIAAWTGMDDRHMDRSDLPERLYKFLKLLLSLNPSDRPSTEDILQGIKTGTGFLDNLPTRSTANSPVQDDFRTMDGASSASSSISHQTSSTAGLTRRSTTRSGSVPTIASEFTSSNENPDRSLSPTKRQPISQEHVAMVRTPSASTVKTQFVDSPPSPVRYRLTPRLLPPPARRDSKLYEFLDFVHASGLLDLTKVAVLCLKMWLCFAPCSTSTPRAEIFYPLLAIAACDLVIRLKNPFISLGLLGLHLACVGLAGRWQLLCEASFTTAH